MDGMGSRIARRLIALAGLLAMVAVLAPPSEPVLGASPTACRVRNLDRGIVRVTLQRAVDAARAGDHLTVRGRCVGLTVIDVSLSIRGVRTATSGAPTLAGAFAGTILTVPPDVTVTIRDLRIREGKGQGRPGGGIVNSGTVVLRGTSAVASNRGTGILNDGVLRLYGSASIRANRGGSLTGGGVYNGGLLELHDRSTIEGNHTEGLAGGIWNIGGIVRLYDHATIRDNTSSAGGGIFNMNGIAGAVASVALNDASSIRGNTARSGGGVLNGGTLRLNGRSRIAANIANETGGGVSNMGTLRLRGSSAIVRNEATWVIGGGVWNDGGTLMGVRCAPASNANVHHNTPDDCSDSTEP